MRWRIETMLVPFAVPEDGPVPVAVAEDLVDADPESEPGALLVTISILVSAA
jgi:hypothetical protein